MIRTDAEIRTMLKKLAAGKRARRGDDVQKAIAVGAKEALLWALCHPDFDPDRLLDTFGHSA